MIINLKIAKMVSITLEASSAARPHRDRTTDELRLPDNPAGPRPGDKLTHRGCGEIDAMAESAQGI